MVFRSIGSEVVHIINGTPVSHPIYVVQLMNFSPAHGLSVLHEWGGATAYYTSVGSRKLAA